MSKLLALIICLSMLMGTTTAMMEHIESKNPNVPLYSEERLTAFEEKNAQDWYWISWKTKDIREWQDCNCVEGEILDAPKDGWLTKEEAVSNAKGALIDLGGTILEGRNVGPVELNEELLDRIENNAIVCAETETGKNLWEIWFYDREWSEGEGMTAITVWIDAESGAVVDCVLPGNNG